MNTEKRLKSVFSKLFGIKESEIDKDSSPDNIDSWDSLNHMNLIIAIEQEFNINFSMEEIVEMLNFELIVLILNKKSK